jgi:penicillin-binding protein 1A
LEFLLPKKTSFFKSALKWLAVLATFVFLLTVALGYAVYSHFEAELPDVQVLRNMEYQEPLSVYSQDGLLLAQFGDKKRIPITVNEVPTQQINAFLAAEDSNFYTHNGVDYRGILRAAIQLLLTGKKKQGGSTITMQVTRNFLLSKEKTYTRKIKEIILALKIEQEFPKQTILELYLNKIFLGHRSYGIASAAQTYYGKDLSELNLAEQAMIAGLPKAPSQYNPVTNPERAIQRRNYVLGRMLALNFISQQQYGNTITQLPTAKLHTQKTELYAPYLAEMVRSKIIEQYGETAYSTGMKVVTTLRADSQTAATKALRESLHEYDNRHGYRAKSHLNINNGDSIKDVKKIGDTIPVVVTTITDDSITVSEPDLGAITISWENLKSIRKFKTVHYTDHPIKSPHELFKNGDIIRIRQLADATWQLSQVPEAEGAFVALNPNNGAILAISGGFDFFNSKYNRATQSSRQPGSGFKPIIYTTALENGFTAASIINDAPIVIDDPNLEAEWRPENYSHKFFGPTRLRTALRKSRNLISIRLLKRLGIKKVKSTALRFGFSPKQLPNSLTLALGSGQATPLQMARLYAVFANGGFRITPFFIDRIESNTGEILFQAEPELVCSTCSDDEIRERKHAPRVISPQVNFIMNTMLRDVVRRGTATRANKLGRKDLAGKTGTTNDQNDAWFNGYSASIAATAWVGFDEPRSLGRSETGGRAALPMWIKFMEQALKNQPEAELIKPEGIVSVLIDPETGLRVQDGKGIFEYFSSNTGPAEYTPIEIDSQNSSETVEEIF